MGGGSMSGFEYLFTFAGLLFGLALANLATGYADVWRDRTRRAIGALTLLLGLVLILSICRQWLSIWSARERLDPDAWSIFTVLFVAGPFVFLSQAMFPRADDDWGSHDEYYFGHRRVLLGVLVISPLVSLISNLISEGLAGRDWEFYAYYLVTIGIPAALVVSSRRWLHLFGLVALCLYLLVQIVMRWG